MSNSIIGDLLVNLAAAAIGALAVRLYTYYRHERSIKAVKWFWAPQSAKKIYLYSGEWETSLSEFGEIEPVINKQDAIIWGELRSFLLPHFSEVVVTTDKDEIDWAYPVVSLGGPVPNPISKEIGGKGLLPVWFLDLPYDKRSVRKFGTKNRSEVYQSAFDANGQITTDIGFVARIKSPQNTNQFIYVIAGNYGVGTLGVIKHLISVEKLAELRKTIDSRCFQAVIRSQLLQQRVVDTTVVHTTNID